MEECQKCKEIERLSNERWASHRREHELIDIARQEAAKNIDRRLDGMNELRAQIDSERGVFLKVSDYTREHKALEEKVDIKTAGLATQVQQIYRFIWMAIGGVATISLLVEGLLAVLEKKL